MMNACSTQRAIKPTPALDCARRAYSAARTFALGGSTLTRVRISGAHGRFEDRDDKATAAPSFFQDSIGPTGSTLRAAI
jgi:hypothetical protein